MKLLKGKRLRPDLPLADQPVTLTGALCLGQASIGLGGWRKVAGMWLPPGSVIARGVMRPAWTEDRAFVLGCWRNGRKRPVLKHGPRSLTSMRVFGCQTHTRNESERR